MSLKIQKIVTKINIEILNDSAIKKRRSGEWVVGGLELETSHLITKIQTNPPPADLL